MSQAQDVYLPVAAGFGVKRDDIWRVYEVEKAVRAAWALTMLSEYRLIQLKKYGVNVKQVALKPVDMDAEPSVGDELLADLLLLFMWNRWQYEQYRSAMNNEIKRKEEELKYAYDYEKDQAKQEIIEKYNELSKDVLEIMTRVRNLALEYIERGEEAFKPERIDGFRRLILDMGYKPKKRFDEPKKRELYEYVKEFTDPSKDMYSYGWRGFFFPRNFENIMSLADELDKFLGRRSKLIQVSKYTLESVEDLQIPSYEEIEREAEELLNRLAYLGGRLEYVISSLAVEGYRKGVTEGIEGLEPSEKAYLEELLDTPFKRVALILAYGKIGNVKRIIQRLNREAFTFSTSTPVAYLKSNVDVRKVFG